MAVDDIKIDHDVNLVINPRDVGIMKSRKEKTESADSGVNIENLLKSVGMDIDPSKMFDSGS